MYHLDRRHSSSIVATWRDSVQIGTPLWACVREAARQFLKAESLSIHCPENIIEEFDKICVKLSDLQPSRLNFPKLYAWDSRDVKIIHEDGCIIISLDEPKINDLWIVGDSHTRVFDLVELIEELAIAGYPGCVGCIGSVEEEPWNEEISRDKLNQKKS